MKIAVFGSGYVGLVAGVCFSDAGHHVIGVDIDKQKVDSLQKGELPIYEPGLDELLKSSIKAKRIQFTTDWATAIKSCQVIFVAVGTPEQEDGSADLSYVLDVAKKVAKEMDGERLIVLKSTVPVGTAETVENLLRDTTKHPFEVISNPEFLKEGASLDDFLKPDRVVVGCKTQNARDVMTELYSPFVRNGKPILFMSNKAAELTKYAANAFLATKISFINELALLCDAVGADINEVKKGFTTDSRINPAFFYPGVGYGGSCFPKDVKALVKTGQKNGVAMHLVQATEKVNEVQKVEMFKKLKKYLGSLDGKTIAIWGLSFKPRTDDVREAPSFTIIRSILAEGGKVTAYDPVAMNNTKKQLGLPIQYSEDAMAALKGADALMVVTEWNEFRSPDFDAMKTLLKNHVIFDGRNIFDPAQVRKHGFKYFCVGREIIT